MLCLFALSLAGCATEELSRRGEKVEVLNQLDRKDCRNLGPVFGKGGGSFGGGWISDENLIEYALNDVRNRAANKGATHLIMSTHQMGSTGGRYGSSTSTATISGIAFKCPRTKDTSEELTLN